MPDLKMADMHAVINYMKVFITQPYTTYWMLDYLIETAGISYEELFKDPKILMTKFKDKRFDAGHEFDKLSSRPGRCTSFAIQVVEKLEARKDTDYNFKFYDLGGHRLARCDKTGTVIDSSSAVGAFVLHEGRWDRFDGEPQHWKWSSGECQFFRTVESAKVVSKPLNQRQCMINCLRELTEDPNPICFFRYFEPNPPKGQTERSTVYLGMLKWRITSAIPRLEFRRKQNGVYQAPEAVILWDRAGSEDTNNAAVWLLADGIVDSKGRERWDSSQREQWDLCKVVHDRLWRAATKLYGYPRVSSCTWYPGRRLMAAHHREIHNGRSPDSRHAISMASLSGNHLNDTFARPNAQGMHSEMHSGMPNNRHRDRYEESTPESWQEHIQRNYYSSLPR